MLNARPNQMIPRRNIKTKGSTTAASAISAACSLKGSSFGPRVATEPGSRLPMGRSSWLVVRLKFSNRFANAINHNCRRHGHAQRNLCRLRIIQRYLTRGKPQSKKGGEKLRDVEQR